MLLSSNYAITAASVQVDFQPQDYLVNPPIVNLTVWGGPTEVDVAPIGQNINNVGFVYTGVVLTFPVALIGKQFSILVTGV